MATKLSITILLVQEMSHSVVEQDTISRQELGISLSDPIRTSHLLQALINSTSVTGSMEVEEISVSEQLTHMQNLKFRVMSRFHLVQSSLPMVTLLVQQQDGLLEIAPPMVAMRSQYSLRAVLTQLSLRLSKQLLEQPIP